MKPASSSHWSSMHHHPFCSGTTWSSGQRSIPFPKTVVGLLSSTPPLPGRRRSSSLSSRHPKAFHFSLVRRRYLLHSFFNHRRRRPRVTQRSREGYQVGFMGENGGKRHAQTNIWNSSANAQCACSRYHSSFPESVGLGFDFLQHVSMEKPVLQYNTIRKTVG